MFKIIMKKSEEFAKEILYKISHCIIISGYTINKIIIVFPYIRSKFLNYH
jgi:hypothetical protein